ncbi:MAG: ion channel [Candidatus Dormibacter sp.]
MLEIVEYLAGVGVVLFSLNEVFQTVVVPRPTPSRFRLARWIVVPGWRLWRRLGLRKLESGSRERMLGTFAPAIVVVLLVTWIVLLIGGFGLQFWAFRQQIHPLLNNIGDAMYFAGTSVLTIGFGDIVGTSGLARLVALAAGASGLGTIALAISFVFSLYASFQRREVLVVMLDARAGAPPSGVSLLEAYSKLGIREDLPAFFAEWERWSAEVLDSHQAYPLLAYFRSSHDNESWVSALGAVLDAATLALTTVVDAPRGPAQLMFSIGRHAVEDLSRIFRIDGGREVGVERYEFDEARERLAAAGYILLGPEESWIAFSKIRSQYAGKLNDMARWWAAPPTQWIGDRSYVKFARERHQGAA